MGKTLETGFDLLYLLLILLSGLLQLFCFWGNPLALLLAGMALVLGGGDLFHLLPRMRPPGQGGANGQTLGRGLLITSLTSTIYYLLLYRVWLFWYGGRGESWGTALYLLALVRILLCLLPQNRWGSGGGGRKWGILRNLPFGAMGALIIGLFATAGSGAGDPFRFVPLAVGISFVCYFVVVLWGRRLPVLGMLMMPKTLCYLWIQAMGLAALSAG